MSTLLELQHLHTRYTVELLKKAYELGYEVTWGETYRTKAQAVADANSGKGIANSLHMLRLAIDINLFKDGQFLTKKEDYEPLGEFWKSLDPRCCWGGDFKDKNNVPKPDSDHFSITYGGVK